MRTINLHGLYTDFSNDDVKEKQSGTSVKGKPKTSKKGNKYLRKAMHLPALTAIRHDERFKSIFPGLYQSMVIKNMTKNIL